MSHPTISLTSSQSSWNSINARMASSSSKVRVVWVIGVRCWTNVVWHPSGDPGTFGGLLLNWHSHRIGKEYFAMLNQSINKPQNSLHYFADLFVAIVLIVGANQKLTQTHNDCGDCCNIHDQSVDECPVESVGGFHNQWCGRESVENASTTNIR